jgi:Sulfotransferase domain
MTTRGAAGRSAARQAIKTSVRRVGLATASLRPLPDFLLIGAKRGGTTSFYFDLLEHPAIARLFPPPVPVLKTDATKGVHYFDSNAFRSESWYRSHFPTVMARQLRSRRTGVTARCGEASPYYLFHPAAAARAHAMHPEARIIALLRDPVMRTYSHWKERRRGNAEPLDFPAALDAEPDRLAGERERLLDDPHYRSYAWEQQSYATQSVYVDSLRPWVDLYGSGRVHVAVSEEYYTDPGRVLGDVHEFLGLPRLGLGSSKIRNAARGDELDPGIRRRLAARFEGPNQALAELTGRELPWL